MLSNAILLINYSRLMEILAVSWWVGHWFQKVLLSCIIFGDLAGLAVVVGMTEISGPPSFMNCFILQKAGLYLFMRLQYTERAKVQVAVPLETETQKSQYQFCHISLVKSGPNSAQIQGVGK